MVKKKKKRGPYLSYRQASDWAKSKNIQTQREWFSLTAMVPKDIPSAPQKFYKEEFKKFGWGGFLQTNRVANKNKRAGLCSFEEAVAWAKENHITTSAMWKVCKNKPSFIPSHPETSYSDFKEKGGWDAFFSRGRQNPRRCVACVKKSFEWAKSMGIQSREDWFSFNGERPVSVPYRPDLVYSNFEKIGGWPGFLSGKWLKQKNFVSIEEASKWAKKMGISSAADWGRLAKKRPYNIPANPFRYYGEKFEEMGGWYGFLGFTKLWQASIVERLMRLVLDEVLSPGAAPHRRQSAIGKSGKKYLIDMAYPEIGLIVEYDGFRFHKDKYEGDFNKTKDLSDSDKGWKVIRVREIGLPLVDGKWDCEVDGTGSHAEKISRCLSHLLSLCEAGVLILTPAQKLNMEGMLKNIDLKKYTDLIRQYQGICSLEEASAWAKKMGFKTQRDWRTYKGVRPANIPSYVDGAYGEEFIEKGGWGWFLGTGRLSNGHKKNVFRSYEEASKWAQDNNIQTIAQWSQHKDKRPADIPGDPRLFYKDVFRARGGWPGFLNTGRVANRYRVFRSMKEAAAWAQDNGISTSTQWKKALKTFTNWPSDVPRCPPRAYKEEFSKAGGWPGFWGSAAP